MTKVAGSGSITQLEKDKPKSKCRKWQLRVPVGVSPRTGKYKIRTRRFSGTWTEAKRALREFIIEIENNQVHQRAGTTIEECAESFMERRRASGEFSDNTNELYERFFKAINRHIGKADASQVDRKMIEEMWAAMRSGDTLSGRPSSGTYLNQLHKTLKLLFDDLVADGIVDKNPCLDFETPQRDTDERRALTSDRMRSLVRELNPEAEEDAAYFIAITMGLRRGEICALSWGDVDFDAKVLSVAHNYDHFHNLKKTKTRAGFRRLPMPSFVSEALLRHKLAQRKRLQEHFIETGERIEQTDDTPVILTRKCQRVDPNNLGAWWRRDRKAFGLDGWCLHELRHSYLSMLAEEGVHPKVMQELAGHASSKTTMDIYTHVNMDIKRAAAGVTEDVFSREGEEERAAAAIRRREQEKELANIIVLGDARSRRYASSHSVKTAGRFEPDSNHPDVHSFSECADTISDQQVS